MVFQGKCMHGNANKQDKNFIFFSAFPRCPKADKLVMPWWRRTLYSQHWLAMATMWQPWLSRFLPPNCSLDTRRTGDTRGERLACFCSHKDINTLNNTSFYYSFWPRRWLGHQRRPLQAPAWCGDAASHPGGCKISGPGQQQPGRSETLDPGSLRWSFYPPGCWSGYGSACLGLWLHCLLIQ